MTLPSNRLLARAALWSGLVAGALDMAAAVLLNLEYPMRVIFQTVASGWLGAAAYDGGWSSAWLGLASHFGIMLVIAVLWVCLAAVRPHLRTRWYTAGPAWGGVVWVVMVFVVLPLSRATLPPPDLPGAIEGLVTHVICIGLPMAWITRRILGAPTRATPPAP